MSDQLMEVISGASHGSNSFVDENFIYRINKITHSRVYLSCRRSQCHGAGKGIKGSNRGEVYNFKLTKSHNHPPEEDKIRLFEVKEYVREEARLTNDTPKDIYERAVRQFDCYDLSRPCVHGLVTRSRERRKLEDETVDSGGHVRRRRKVDKNEQETQITYRSPTVESDSLEEDDYEAEEGVLHEEIDVQDKYEEVYVKSLQEEQRVTSLDCAESADEQEDVHDETEFDDPELDGYASSTRAPSGSCSGEDSDASVAQAPKRSRVSELGHTRDVIPSTSYCSLRHKTDRSYCESEDEEMSPTKVLTVEESLMRIFSSTYFRNKENVFNLLKNPSLPERSENGTHLYSFSDTLNILRSASKLCQFATVKANQMKRLLIGRTEDLNGLEDVLIEHLSSLMCFTGTEFFQNCFGQSLREAIGSGKQGTRGGRQEWNEEEIVVRGSDRRMQLAVALLCYSGKAYNALSELIDLPGPHLTRKWATNDKGYPGFSAQAFAAIRREVAKNRHRTLFVSLAMEDVPLKKATDWSHPQLTGYTDLGYGRIDHDSIPEATRAVVFHVTAINKTWRLPLGYCLAEHLSPMVRANLISQYASKLEFSGVKVAGIVLDNSTLSHRVFAELGVYPNDALPLGAVHTTSDEKIRTSPFIEMLEVMESLRSLLKEKETFLSPNGDEIKWSLIDQTEETFRDSSNHHLEFILGGIPVELLNYSKVLQTKIQKDSSPFSRYLLIAMKILKKCAIRDFEAEATIDFVTQMVAITDMFRCRNKFHKNRRFFNGSREIFTTINKWLHYLGKLKLPDGDLVRNTNRGMPVTNLCMNLSSAKIVVQRVSSSPDKLFHRFSLEGVRNFVKGLRLGELPTPKEFREEYVAAVANIDESPSGQIPRQAAEQRKAKLMYEINVSFFSSKVFTYSPMSSMCDSVSHFLVEKSINVYIEYVECAECFHVILNSMQSHDTAERPDLYQDLTNMFLSTEKELRLLNEIPPDLAPQSRQFSRLANTVLLTSTFEGCKAHDHLFDSVEFGDVAHFTRMMKDMIGIYIQVRLRYMFSETKIGIDDFQESSLKYSSGRNWA